MPLRILDLCAAPGGKSTLIQSMISGDSLLMSNEVIRSRVNVLKDNIIKWGAENVVVTNNDPKDFQALQNYFDLVVVDAPCSGSGLFRRSPGAAAEWSERIVALCSQRQQRILADILPALKPGGTLIYSTCSYSKEENEEIIDWLLKELPIAYCPLQIEPGWGIVDTKKGLRFWPDKLKGEGFFLACLKKTEDSLKIIHKRKPEVQKISKGDSSVIEHWINKGENSLLKIGEKVFAMNEKMKNDLQILQGKLDVKYCGVELGQVLPGKFIPAHALAMSNLLNSSVPGTELDLDSAILYLQKKTIELNNVQAGWQTVSFQRHRLGWINILPGRINNYYPKELRILKDLPAADR